ncbi:hypothetical protein AB0J42_22650 [Nonomuraea sp. NPDC049649]|uniref:hypothetical protein n=1 Tax=Nonomuraea sp. NPDC049649 TaxID=3155776 RepID=UPI003431C88A
MLRHRRHRCGLPQAQLDGAYFSDCVLLGIGGVASLRGAIVSSRNVQGLGFALAGALGILIEE